MAIPAGNAYSVASGVTIYAGRTALVAGSGVTINDVADYTLYQRVGTSKTVSLSGTCTGSPSRIEWRLVDWLTGVPRTSWATLVNNPAASWNASIDYPQGGWDKVEVRDAVNTALTHSTVSRMGVGIVVAMYGQSNMANMPTAGFKRPLGDRRSVHMNASNVVARIGNINDTKAPNLEQDQTGYALPSEAYSINAPNGDGFVYLANLIAQGMSCPVMLVERAVGGQEIAALTKGSATAPQNWNNYEAKLVAAGGDFELAVFHQGESDARLKSTAHMVAAYKTVRNDHMAINGRTAANFRMFFIGLGAGSYLSSLEGDFGKMREAHRLMAYESACGYAGTAHTGYTNDGVHLMPTSFNNLYRRVAKSVLAWLGVGVSGAGPEAVSASRSGDRDVIVTVQHAGGNALMDGAGGDGTALRGFQVYDDGAAGAQLTVESTWFPSATSIRVTTTTTPVGPLRISFGMMNNPHNQTQAEGGIDANAAKNPPLAATIPCDNAAYHNSAVGCPLRPFAAISVS